MTERELLLDCLHRLDAAAVTYMLTGSMASNYWGVPRSTHDLDFVLKLPRESIPALTAAFADDFLLQRSTIESAYSPPHQFNAIDQRSALKVDFWMLRDDPFEQAMFARRTQVNLFGTSAWIATAEDCLLHKLYWHKLGPSDRQLSDAAGIVAVQAGKLDVKYLRLWAATLDVLQTLEELLQQRIRPKTT